MDVGFVDHYNGAFGFVLDKVLDVGVWRDRACWIVGRANVEESGVGRRGEHGLDVMSIGFGKRNFHHTGLGRLCREHTSFVTGIGSDVAVLRRSERDDRETKGRAGTGKCANVIGSQAFHLRESVNQVFCQTVGVATTLRDNRGEGVTCGLAGAKRIFISVDEDRIFVVGERFGAIGRG